MKWSAVIGFDGRPSQYSINSGQWWICKSIVSGRGEVFTLFHGNKRMGDFDTAEKAKERAKKE